jgi:hypothetical protein
VTVNEKAMTMREEMIPDSYQLRRLDGGDYALTIRHHQAGDILISN